MSKFDSLLAELLYEDFADEEIGSVSELGWAGRFDDELAILYEDSQGFVWVDTFDTYEGYKAGWKELEEAYEEFDYGLIV